MNPAAAIPMSQDPTRSDVSAPPVVFRCAAIVIALTSLMM
jgi:hypothetical protein